MRKRTLKSMKQSLELLKSIASNGEMSDNIETFNISRRQAILNIQKSLLWNIEEALKPRKKS